MAYAFEALFGRDNSFSQSSQNDEPDSGWNADDLRPSNCGGFPTGFAPWSTGQELLLHDSGELTAAGADPAAPAEAGGQTQSLTPTLVGVAGGLQFNLIWDSSVGAAPVRVEHALVAAAKYYSKLYSNPEVINIHVGLGEINGASMSSDALGESESYGYMTTYGVVESALQRDSSSSPYQKSADATLSAANPTGAGQFFVTTAEAKALGLSSGASTATDGYIGLNDEYPLDYRTNVPGNHIGPNRFDAIGIAKHEISEVMGRVGSVGLVMGPEVYTPLDLFRYAANGMHDFTPAAGYFSVDDGATSLGEYNNPQNGGDAADWAAGLVGDSYGDGYRGHRASVSPADIIENAALGYRRTPDALAATHAIGFA
jgi:hypothetical protein